MEPARTLASMRSPSSVLITPSGRSEWPEREARVMSEVLSALSRSTCSPILWPELSTVSMVKMIWIAQKTKRVTDYTTRRRAHGRASCW
jgi:hypothetical protein